MNKIWKCYVIKLTTISFLLEKSLVCCTLVTGVPN